MFITASPQARRTSLLAFGALLAHCLWAGEVGRAQRADKSPTGTVSLTVRISVTDRDSGQVVSGAEISIPRSGRNAKGDSLKELKLRTDQNGEVTRKDAVFHIGGSPHKLSVTAENFKPLELDLPDVVLREAAHFDQQFTLALSLTRLAGQSPLPSTNAPGATNEDRLPYFLSRVPEWLTAPVVLLIVSAILCTAAVLWWFRSMRIYSIRRGDHVEPKSHPDTSSRRAARELVKLKDPLAQPPIIRKGFDAESTLKEISERLLKIERSISLTHETVEKLSFSLHAATRSPSSSNQTAKTGEGSTAATSAPSAVGESESSRHLPFKKRAHLSYVKLAKRETPDQKPIYVEVQTKTSLFGKLADSIVYLTQATHRQSAFVLFTEDDKLGWVFPNPALAFRKLSLKDVFPALTEEEFVRAKEKIEPARVVRVDEFRWKVS